MLGRRHDAISRRFRPLTQRPLRSLIQSPLRSLIRHPRTQLLLAALVSGYLSFCYRTTRWSLVGEANLLPHVQAAQPVIAAFWHERLPMMPALWRIVAAQHPGTAGWLPRVLVSQHRDGRFIGGVVARLGVGIVHGSTSRGGAAAMRALLRVLREGHPVIITPDGPRGPRRQTGEGVAQIARLSGVPVLPMAAATRRHRLLRSWDRMMLPLPFTTGVLVCGAAQVVRDDPAAATVLLRQAMTDACDLADAWIAGQAPGTVARRV